MDYETDIRCAPGMRVLVTFEDVRRLYRDVFVRAILEDRPPQSELLAVIDETYERLREGTLSQSC